MECWMRLSVPDRTGALGAIAVALASAGADIRSLDVVTVEDGIAVDDLVIDTPAGPRRSAATRGDRRGRRGGPAAAAPSAGAGLAPGGRRPAGRGVGPPAAPHARGGAAPGLHSAWCAVLRQRNPRPQVLAASVGAPSFTMVETPWLPLAAPRRLDAALWMHRAWREGHPQHTLAAAPLGEPRTAVLLARRQGPRFYAAEVAELAALARLAAALLPDDAVLDAASA